MRKAQSIHNRSTKTTQNGYQHTKVKCAKEKIDYYEGWGCVSFCLCYLMPKCGHLLWAMKLILTVKGKAQINRIKFHLNSKWVRGETFCCCVAPSSTLVNNASVCNTHTQRTFRHAVTQNVLLELPHCVTIVRASV